MNYYSDTEEVYNKGQKAGEKVNNKIKSDKVACATMGGILTVAGSLPFISRAVDLKYAAGLEMNGYIERASEIVNEGLNPVETSSAMGCILGGVALMVVSFKLKRDYKQKLLTAPNQLQLNEPQQRQLNEPRQEQLTGPVRRLK